MKSSNKVAEEYHKWYYYTGIWKNVTFLGIPTEKSVSDMWNYQEIITSIQPGLVIEFGVLYGGSTLFFRVISKLVNPNSIVIAVDNNVATINPLVKASSDIIILNMSSVDRALIDILKEYRSRQGKTFAILDSNHSKEHVLQELNLISQVLESGDYLIVEDGNINGNPVRPGWGDGPLEAINEYMSTNPHVYSRDFTRESKFGFTFAPNGFLIKN